MKRLIRVDAYDGEHNPLMSQIIDPETHGEMSIQLPAFDNRNHAKPAYIVISGFPSILMGSLE